MNELIVLQLQISTRQKSLGMILTGSARSLFNLLDLCDGLGILKIFFLSAIWKR